MIQLFLSAARVNMNKLDMIRILLEFIALFLKASLAASYVCLSRYAAVKWTLSDLMFSQPVTMESTIFLKVTPCSLVEVLPIFRRKELTDVGTPT